MGKKKPQPAATPPANSVQPASRAAWRAWLEANHTQTEGVWVVTYKKAANKPRLTYDEMVEEALCFGWVDSKPGKLDDARTMLYFAPRKPRSGWSKPNKERVARLIEAGLLAPAGLAKIEAAQKDGSWSALDAVEALEVPADLATALAALPNATELFDAFPRSVKRGILEWIASAKKPETRTKRVEETATLAAENKRANQWRG
ncbi:MAG: YdeI/OmpD-associated family protein [Gemmataceae bacterium]|nr:YdeI/OmpD-associated family protein [Gemmataceae bacterium]